MFCLRRLRPPNLYASIKPRTAKFTPRRSYAQYRFQRFGDSGQQRAGPFESIARQWRNSQVFRYCAIGAIGVGGYTMISNIEEVPVTGRRRLNFFSWDSVKAHDAGGYKQILNAYRGKILPWNDPRVLKVQEVMNRLIPASGLTDEKWEVFVIDDPQMNAFVIPGGKVFVFTGILPICSTEDGLAAVLGHEIAHNVAQHAAELMTNRILVSAAATVLAFLGIDPSLWLGTLSEFTFQRPASRRQESEADYIGLLMMAESCFNPSAAVGIWERMAKAQKVNPPQFLSTHPSDSNRGKQIQNWLPKALERRSLGSCGAIQPQGNLSGQLKLVE